MSPVLTLIACMLFISLACHESCADSCAGGSPKDCEKCKEGWEMTEEDGCKGISTICSCTSYICSDRVFQF